MLAIFHPRRFGLIKVRLKEKTVTKDEAAPSTNTSDSEEMAKVQLSSKVALLFN